MNDEERLACDLPRREFLRCVLGGVGACLAAPALAKTAVYHGSSYPVREVKNLPKRDGLGLQVAKYWQGTGNEVQCSLCPKYCQLREGALGPCRIRQNRGRKLYTTVYGAPCIVFTNAIEQGPVYHVTPGALYLAVGTAGCNLRCKYCQNWQQSQTTASDTDNYDLPPAKLVEVAKRERCRGILYTFTEAVVSAEYTLDIAKAARAAGLKNVMITAAYVDEEPFKDMLAYFDAVRIDLKGFTDQYYRDVIGGSLAPVLTAIKAVKGSGVWLEVVNLVVTGLNDDPNQFRKMAEWLVQNIGTTTPLHISRFYPAYKLRNLPSTPISTLERLRKIARDEGLQYVYLGGCPGHEAQNTFCAKCGKELVHRIGFVSVEDNQIRGGKCRFCLTPIPGVWS